ncbi:MAG: precorrin-3B C(17)-methyltransferase [Dehalococcoidales bacterium]|nr:precorrin-3B C(17)-methyltransferase [Dehalococcoidales bacterium]
MSDSEGKILVVGIGPGSPEHLTVRAREALAQSDVVVGYKTYVGLIKELLDGKELVSSGMRQEVARARKAVDLARLGKTVAVISSGDAGVYGMAGLVYEVAREVGWSLTSVEIIPGVSALNAAASLLGAPLMHDFAVISLSDLLTPWAKIADRLEMAAQADFVIVLYNPRSSKRTEQIVEAQRIVRRYRDGSTPAGIVNSAFREGQQIVVTDLDHMLDFDVGMLSIVLIGNSSTTTFDGLMVTPRGYERKYDLADSTG